MVKDKLVFFFKSEDDLPGKGVKEHINIITKYEKLSQIKDWRKMLSDFYIHPFIVDEEEWLTVDHFVHACKFRKLQDPNYYKYYKTFTSNGGEIWSKDPTLAWFAGQAGKKTREGNKYNSAKLYNKVPQNIDPRPDFTSRNIDKKAMTIARFAKFSQNKELKNVLLETNDADLFHLIMHKDKPSEDKLSECLISVRETIRAHEPFCDIADISKFSKETINEILN